MSDIDQGWEKYTGEENTEEFVEQKSLHIQGKLGYYPVLEYYPSTRLCRYTIGHHTLIGVVSEEKFWKKIK